jgi:hypothetical protein
MTPAAMPARDSSRLHLRCIIEVAAASARRAPVLPSGVRYALLAGLVLSTRAHADDPRDLFGLGGGKQAAQVTCDDAKLLGCATASDDLDPVSPYATRTWLPATYLLKLPVADSRADAVAHFATGVSRDEAGLAIGGASGLENRWTIEGAPADGVRTGSHDTRVPLTFIRGILVQTGGFAARDRTSTGGTIDIQLLRGTPQHEVQAHVWAGLHADATRRELAANSFQLRRLFVDAGPDVSASLVATGPLPRVLGGKAWYAAGIAPALAFTDFTWQTSRLVDRDGDQRIDGFPGIVDLESIGTAHERTLDYLVPMMARVGWERGPHSVELTLIGHANRDTSMLANATQQAAGIDRTGYTGDAIATWTGSWKAARARIQVAWHRNVRDETAHDARAADPAQFLSIYVPATLPEDSLLASKCYDRDPTNPIPGEPDDDYPGIPNCPIPFGFFASGGAGLLTDSTADRPTTTADIAHRFGRHVVRAGGTFEDSRLVQESRYTGGALVRSLFPDHTDTQRFYDGVCSSFTIIEPETRCEYKDSQTLRYRTRYTAAFLEDTFEPVPKLRVDGGLRWELMWVGTELHMSREYAPRLGVAYELWEGSRLWASMGRSFVMLPAGLGPTVIARNHTARDVEFGLGPSRSLQPGNVFEVADGLRPAAQDEATAGIEYGVPKILRAAAWVQGRTLRRGYETVIYGDSGLAAFDNPGRHPEEAPAERNAITFAAEAMIAPSPKMTVRATYLFNRTTGSWTGPFDPRQGANLFDGDDWDDSSGNIYGRLPTDAGHRFAFEIERRGRVRGIEWLAAARLTTQSGRPRSVLGIADGGVIYLLQRGDNGRNELVSQANVRLGARWKRTEVTLDIFNLFDHRTPTLVDELYAQGDMAPINGGEARDLVWLKTSDGDPVARRTAYGLPLSYQSPIAVTLGVHQTF